MNDRSEEDIFLLSGRLRPDIVDESTSQALREALCFTRATNWDSVRTPHLFMGLLSAPDHGVAGWSSRLGADISKLLDQFRDLFYQEVEPVPPLLLNREFLSDNVLRLLRDSYSRARDFGRTSITQMDILITIFSTPNSIVAECFERIGVSASHLTETAVAVEREVLLG